MLDPYFGDGPGGGKCRSVSVGAGFGVCVWLLIVSNKCGAEILELDKKPFLLRDGLKRVELKRPIFVINGGWFETGTPQNRLQDLNGFKHKFHQHFDVPRVALWGPCGLLGTHFGLWATIYAQGYENRLKR